MKKSYEPNKNKNTPSKLKKKIKINNTYLNYLDVYLCSTQASVEQ